MRCGRPAAAGCSPTEPSRPSRAGRHRTTLAQRPPSVVTTSRSSPWSAPRRRPAQDALPGPVSTCSVPCSGHPAGTLALDQRPWSARWGQGGAAAGTPATRRPWLRSTSGEQAPATVAPSLAVRPDAGRRPRRPQTTGARRPAAPNRGRPATPSHSGVQRADTCGGSAADTRACPAGHLDALDTGRLDAGMSAGPVGRTSHGGPDEADRATTGPAGVRTSSRPAIPAGRPDLARVTATGGRSATQDGSVVTAPAPRPDRRRHWTAAQHRPA
jgi:hypothetical protein